MNEKRFGNHLFHLKFASNGCPNEGGFRSLIWKILLNYLHPDKSKWPDILSRRRNEYREFVREIVIRPGYKKDDQNQELDHVIILLRYF